MNPPALFGESTLVASWRALARTSPGAIVRETAGSVAAIFPAWAPLNNAIARFPVADVEATARGVARLSAQYRNAGVGPWAYWVPSPTRDLVTADAVRIPGLTRDASTLVMRAQLGDGFALADTVRTTSVTDAARAGDEPVPVDDLEEPEPASGLDAWVLAHDGAAVAGAWTLLHEGDCGVYAVGTAPGWRRRGFARTLVAHALADARRRGARTASLQSTPEAVTLYRALGFEAVGRYEEWIVDASAFDGAASSGQSPGRRASSRSTKTSSSSCVDSGP
jgi:ribosomal protein S18 acetylase RimI-like enzyme